MEHLSYGNEENIKRWWRYLIHRFSAYNVIWVMAGEYNMYNYGGFPPGHLYYQEQLAIHMEEVMSGGHMFLNLLQTERIILTSGSILPIVKNVIHKSLQEKNLSG